jgi:hypothetical protein
MNTNFSFQFQNTNWLKNALNLDFTRQPVKLLGFSFQKEPCTLQYRSFEIIVFPNFTFQQSSKHERRFFIFE